MKIPLKIPWIVTTSDDYLDLMPEFALRFNEYVGVFDVTVLCFKKPEHLPKNFDVVSLGKQADFGDLYTDPLLPYFSTLKSKFFFHLLEDYYMTDYMNHRLLKRTFKYCLKNNIRPSKIDLYGTVASRPHTSITNNIILADQNTSYRSSLQGACWRTEYWKELLVPGRNPWQFEKIGSGERANDGAFVFGCNYENSIVKYRNKSHRGKFKKSKVGKKLRRLISNSKKFNLKGSPYVIKGIDSCKL